MVDDGDGGHKVPRTVVSPTFSLPQSTSHPGCHLRSGQSQKTLSWAPVQFDFSEIKNAVNTDLLQFLFVTNH